MNEAVGFLSVPAPCPPPSLALSFFLTFAPWHTHTQTYGRGCGQRQDGDQQEPTDNTSWMKPRVCVRVIKSTHWLERCIIYLWGCENLIPTPLTKISSVFAGFSQLETEEAKVLIIYLCVKLLIYVCLIICVIIKSTFLPTMITPTSTHPGPGWKGGKKAMDDGGVSSSTITHATNSCLVTGVCSSLWPHPLLTSTAPFPPQAAQAIPWLLWAPFLYFLLCCCNSSGRGVSRRCGVLHACPVFLLAPLLAARRRQWGC